MSANLKVFVNKVKDGLLKLPAVDSATIQGIDVDQKTEIPPNLRQALFPFQKQGISLLSNVYIYIYIYLDSSLRVSRNQNLQNLCFIRMIINVNAHGMLGVAFVLAHEGRALIGDEMGLGKTIQV